jgi:hypothetical protein
MSREYIDLDPFVGSSDQLFADSKVQTYTVKKETMDETFKLMEAKGKIIQPTTLVTLVGRRFGSDLRVIPRKVNQLVYLDSLRTVEQEEPLTLVDLTEVSRSQAIAMMSLSEIEKAAVKGTEIVTVDGEPYSEMLMDVLTVTATKNSRFQVVHFVEDIEEGQKVKKIRTRRHGRYTSRLLLAMREKFVWDLTDMTATNKACLHHYAVQVMKQDGLRMHDRSIILKSIVRKYFTPTEDDVEEANAMNSYAMHKLRENATAVRVDHGWQRWWRFGVRAPVARPVTQ